MDPFIHAIEHILTLPEGMRIIVFYDWLRLRLASRALLDRFRRGAVPAFLRYLRTCMQTATQQVCNVAAVGRIVIGGRFVDDCVRGCAGLDGSAALGVPASSLRLYVPDGPQDTETALEVRPDRVITDTYLEHVAGAMLWYECYGAIKIIQVRNGDPEAVAGHRDAWLYIDHRALRATRHCPIC